ncbi:hypothetical protein [Glutamicibacter creatinolyticus]|uniref:hypothetical protein n=1 Tax=Glutamicibacter creatinolyticus TaxID=162496 RepID=UPI001110B301|nr:hypothetical protein [Glutamicibacter creatinolyticus]
MLDKFEQFVTASAEALIDDKPRSRSTTNKADEVDKLEAKRLKQAHRFRKRLFRHSLWLVWISLGTCVVVVLWAHFRGTKLEDGVAIAFLTGTTVEIIAVLAIIANYLFPKDRGIGNGS